MANAFSAFFAAVRARAEITIAFGVIFRSAR